jgi:hypothetical protein
MSGAISRRTAISRILPAAVVAAAAPSLAKAEGQPHMQEALDSLRAARRQLLAATPDKGGHRQRAVRLVNQAIAEVERGVRFDDKR